MLRYIYLFDILNILHIIKIIVKSLKKTQKKHLFSDQKCGLLIEKVPIQPISFNYFKVLDL